MASPQRRTSNRKKNTTDSTIPPVTKKTGRGKRVHELEDTEGAPKKKAKVVNTNPDTQPGPRRSTRSPKPNGKGVIEKKTRRSKAEVQEAKAAIEEAKKRKEEEAREAMERLARMDIDNDNDRAQTAAKIIRRLSDVGLNDASDSGEEFVGFDEVSSTESTSADESKDTDALKENYEALQKQIKALQKKIGSGGGGKKKKTQGGKKSKKDVTYASGLLADWNRPTKDVSKKSLHHVNISAGGLDDDDADAISPYSTKNDNPSKVPQHAVKAGRDLSRQNELVALVPHEEIAQPIVKRSVRPSGGKTAIPTKAVPTTVKINTECKEGVHPGKETKKANDDSKTKKLRVINSNNVRVDNLPDFARDQTWRKAFLPTLYDKFFASSNPFSQFAKGSNEFVSLLQSVMKEVYPNVKYKVSASDAIHGLAYNRINEKRSTVGSNAVKVLKNHIGTLDGAQVIRDWLLWASRGDGPLFFKEPVAPDAPLDRKHPGYVNPRGKLLTKFIIELVTPYLRLNSGSVSSSGRPRGLIALSMAALERAVQVHLHKDVADFSIGSWGSKATTYYNNLENIEDSRWEELLDACSSTGTAAENADKEYQANLSFLDHNRATLFNFSSPAKS